MKNVFYSLVLFLLCCFFSATYSQTQLGANIDGDRPLSRSGASVSMSSDGSRVVIGAVGEDQISTTAGRVKVYEWQNNAWTQLGGNIDGATTDDDFGWSVAMASNGTRVAIGAPNGGAGTRGSVQVYEWDNMNWVQVGSTLEGDMSNNFFGSEVTLNADGTVLAVSDPDRDDTPGGNPGSGQVKVYGIFNGAWTEIGLPFDLTNNNALEIVGGIGYALALSGTGQTVAYTAPTNQGSPQGSPGLGGLAIYDFIAGIGWVIQDTIFSSFNNETMGLTMSMSTDGNRIAVSSAIEDIAGVNPTLFARVYEKSIGSWMQMGDSIALSSALSDLEFELSLSDDGSRLAVGFPVDSSATAESVGKTQIYDWVNGAWTQAGSDIFGQNEGEQSGYAVALAGNGERVAIGAIGGGAAPNPPGYTRVYDLTNLTALEGLAQEVSLSVFPNPVKDQVQFTINSETASSVAITITNMLGQTVAVPFTGSILPNQVLKIPVNMSDLQSGMYQFQVTYEDGSTQTGKLLRLE